MSESDQMSPDSSPGASSRKTGVRRVNNVPVLIAVGVLVLFLALIAMVAVKRSNDANGKAADLATGKGGNSSLIAADIVGGRTDGMIGEAKTDPPALAPPGQASAGTDAGSQGIPVAPVSNPNEPPKPPRGAGNQAVPESEEVVRLRQEKFQSFVEAVEKKTSIEMKMPDLRAQSGVTDDKPKTRDEMLDRIAQVRRQIDQQRTTDPNAAYQAQLRQVQSTIGGASPGGGVGGGRSAGRSGSSAGMMLASPQNSSTREYSAFSGDGKKDRWTLDSTIEAPTTPFQIRAGAVIPGIMLSGVNSDLPGQIMAQVSQDVFDTATGKYVLIPQGTRLVGSYSSDVAFGQEAVMIAWQRLVFPDGKALDIGAMPGADMAGYSGFRDQVDNHLWRIYGSALFMAGITAGASMATDQGQGNSGTGFQQPSVSSELSSALGQQLGQVSAQIVSKNLNVAPTLNIRPGYRFNIVVVKDVAFNKAYQSFDY
ncbi:TrbI/VirB10 family protein [Pseudomonas syringae]|uniref:TrbI/VirB10 family protein n=1 Tax=Pseudomonas syringae TaxID=317 RepID=UPI00200ABF44|nr:TrbI/VirB10 family protein [Pseudomonas syringae]MCK9709893.1 conjugal transfer protein TrbI [Pseudomonas syringae pv. syringae]